MAILMLDGKQRFITTDHIVTGYVTGRENDAQIVLRLINDEITLLRHYKSFAEAGRALDNLAKAIAEGMNAELNTWLEMHENGVYR